MNMPREHWMFIEYETLITDPEKQIRNLCQFTLLEIDGVLESMLKQPLPLSQTTLTPPHPAKWRRHAKEIDRLMPSLEVIMAKIETIQRKSAESVISPP
jgi:hypothetical protein